MFDCLSKHRASDVRSGMTVKEIAEELDEAESVIRIDLGNLKSEGVERDSKRIPNVYWLSRGKQSESNEDR